MKKNISWMMGCILLLINSVALSAFPVTVKIATLAPEGTTWDLYLKNFAREIERKTKKAIDVQIYSGGVLGDEADYINLLRAGKIDAAGVTVHGISLVAKEFLVMATPFQFKNYREVDAALDKFRNTFTSMFQKKGYVPYILDHGFIYAY